MLFNIFKKYFYNCFGVNNEETIHFNKIKKIIVKETESKLPDINDKWKVISFFDKINNLCETIFGNTVEFILQNPNEIPCNVSNSIKYKINMFNKKTKKILNRLIFNIKYDSIEKTSILIIKPEKNELISSNHWNFIDSVFYNMGFQTKQKYYNN
jgi:hypothetical protein